MAFGLGGLLRGSRGGDAAEVERHTVGNALVLHTPGKISSEAQNLALAIAIDPENEVVVLDLGAALPTSSWEAIAAAIPRGRRGIRLMACGQHRDKAALVGQWLSERLNRTVVAPDGVLVRSAAGTLFVDSATGSGWVRFRKGRPPALIGKRYPAPPWDTAVTDMHASSATGEIEPLPGGVWIRPTGDPAAVARHRNRLVADVPCYDDSMTVLIGCPGSGALHLDDVVRFWRDLAPEHRTRARFVQYGDVHLPAGTPFGQVLADTLGTNVVCYSGVPVGSRDDRHLKVVRSGGVLGWEPFALELGFTPRVPEATPRRATVLGHRPPIKGADELEPRVYWYAPDAVVEVVEAGLWIRSPKIPAGSNQVRAAGQDPETLALFFDDGVTARTQRMRELATDLAARLDPEGQEFAVVVAASKAAEFGPHGVKPTYPTPSAPTPGAASSAAPAAASAVTPASSSSAASAVAPAASSSAASVASAAFAGAPSSPSSAPAAAAVPASGGPTVSLSRSDVLPASGGPTVQMLRSEVLPPAPTAPSAPTAPTVPPTATVPPAATAPTVPPAATAPTAPSAATAPTVPPAVTARTATHAVAAPPTAPTAFTPPTPPDSFASAAVPEPPATASSPPVEPSVAQPSVAQPSVAQPSVAQPSGVQESGVQESIAQAPVAPTPAPPAPAPPTRPASTAVRTHSAGPIRAALAPAEAPAFAMPEPVLSPPAEPAVPAPVEPVPTPPVDEPTPALPVEATAPLEPTSAPPAERVAEHEPVAKPEPVAASVEAVPAKPIRASGGVLLQPVPDTAASALAGSGRALTEERKWFRRALGAKVDQYAGAVEELLAAHPGLRGNASDEDAVLDAVALRLFLRERGPVVNDGLRGARPGPHVPFGRLVLSALSRLPAHRGTTVVRATPLPGEWELYRNRLAIKDWSFTAALAAPCAGQEGDTDVLIWSLDGRRCELLEPEGAYRVEDRVLFAPGTSFKILELREPAGGERGTILLRELGANEIAADGKVAANRVSFDELALTSLQRSRDKWAVAEPRHRIGEAATTRFRPLPGLTLAPAAKDPAAK